MGSFLSQTLTIRQGFQVSQRASPSFVVIGAQRAGTTTVHRYLRAHPHVHFATKTKEIHYFDLNFGLGLDWYLSHFPEEEEIRRLRRRDGTAVTGDSTPYYIFHPLAAQRMKEVLPNAKIIVLLRDPVSRAISHYHHAVRKGYETLPLREALDAEASRLAGEEQKIATDPAYHSFAHQQLSYAARGFYKRQLERWLKLFPRGQFLFIRSDVLFSQPDRACAQLCDFIGVRFHPLPSYEAHNSGLYPPADPEAVAELRRLFESPNRQLATLLGADFDFNLRS